MNDVVFGPSLIRVMITPLSEDQVAGAQVLLRKNDRQRVVKIGLQIEDRRQVSIRTSRTGDRSQFKLQGAKGLLK